MSVDFEYPVFCPLMKQKIDMDICFDIHMVVEGGTPLYTAPKQIYEFKDYVDICNHCRYHRND